MMTHELDLRSRMRDGIEPGVVPGVEPDDTTVSDIVVRTVQKWLEENGGTFSQSDRFLGLGAGDAYPEMQIADRLGFSSTDITLVDKRFSSDARSRFAINYPQTTLIESGMFNFLERSPEQNYSFVTALGVEHSLNIPEAVDSFISALSKMMRRGGIIAVFPYIGSHDPSSHWAGNGFEPLYPLTTFRGGHADALINVCISRQASSSSSS